MRSRRLLAVFAQSLAVAATACGGSETVSTADASASDAGGNAPDSSCSGSPSTSVTLPRTEVQAAYDNEENARLHTDAGSYPLPDAGYGPFLGPGCGSLCGDGSAFDLCTITAETSDSVTISCHVNCTGRRPAGYRAGRRRAARTAAGDHFAQMAELEAASIDAFRSLRGELAILGAPKRILARCSRAARDERRHARATAALARRFGADPVAPRTERRPPRSLEAIAIENVVEGCVRETFGALIAHAQSQRAADRTVRDAMARIAREETQHATLAWQIHAWASVRLDRAARARVDAAKRSAIATLAVGEAIDPTLAAVAGLPPPTMLRALKSELVRTLWA